MNSPAFNIAKLTLPLKSLLIPLVILLLALVLTIGRAFNTGDMTDLHRFGLWFAVCASVAIQVLFFERLLQRLVFKLFAYGRILASLSSVILTVLVVAIQLHILKYTPLLPKKVDPPLEFLAFVGMPIAVISVIFIVLKTVLDLASINPAREPIQNERKLSRADRDAAENFKGLPEWRHSRTLRIQVEDHYLRIFNEHRQFYIRGKMSDVLDLLDANNGVQVHRSHWVSFAHIEQLAKEGRDYQLRLSDGNSVPVSRGRVNEVRERLEYYKRRSM